MWFKTQNAGLVIYIYMQVQNRQYIAETTCSFSVKQQSLTVN